MGRSRWAEPELVGCQERHGLVEGVRDAVWRGVRVHLGEEFWPVADGDGAEFPGEVLVARSGSADDVVPSARASWVAIRPTEPLPPRMSSVSPRATRSCRRVPTAASAEAGSAAASAQLTPGGLAV